MPGGLNGRESASCAPPYCFNAVQTVVRESPGAIISKLFIAYPLNNNQYVVDAPSPFFNFKWETPDRDVVVSGAGRMPKKRLTGALQAG